MKLTNKQYDILKWIALIVLPAVGTLYFTLSTIWGLPYGDQVVGTITAVDTFLGALLGVSTSQHNKRKAASTKRQQNTYDVSRLSIRGSRDVRVSLDIQGVFLFREIYMLYYERYN